MFDEPTTKAMFGAVAAMLHKAPGEFISARNFYSAGLAAGLDMTNGDPERRAPTLGAMTRAFSLLSFPDQRRALTSLVKSLMTSGTENANQGANLLSQYGATWDGNNIVAAGVFDERERVFLPATSAADLAKAVDRLNWGDESGSIGAACGAVDLATGAAYEKLGLGDPGNASFSTKVNTALQKMGAFGQMRNEFLAIGMDEKDANEASQYLQRAINESAQALQILRKRMGDVHGTRPALRGTAYDCIKFASAICALFKDQK